MSERANHFSTPAFMMLLAAISFTGLPVAGTSLHFVTKAADEHATVWGLSKHAWVSVQNILGSLFVVAQLLSRASWCECEASSAGEFHPRVLAQPYVNLSAHAAPIIRPPVSRQEVANEQAGSARDPRPSPASALLSDDGLSTSCISSWLTSPVCH